MRAAAAEGGLRRKPLYDVAVIGGGIIGTSAAAFLAEAGASVVLFERTAIGAGTLIERAPVVIVPSDQRGPR